MISNLLFQAPPYQVSSSSDMFLYIGPHITSHQVDLGDNVSCDGVEIKWAKKDQVYGNVNVVILSMPS